MGAGDDLRNVRNESAKTKTKQQKVTAMKTLKNILSKLCRPAALVVIGLALFASTSQAAKITFLVQANGHADKGWILVVPDSNTGGRVLWDSRYGWYTDRVVRGERFCDIIEASNTTEKASTGACLWTVRSDRALLYSKRLPLTISET